MWFLVMKNKKTERKKESGTARKQVTTQLTTKRRLENMANSLPATTWIQSILKQQQKLWKIDSKRAPNRKEENKICTWWWKWKKENLNWSLVTICIFLWNWNGQGRKWGWSVHYRQHIYLAMMLWYEAFFGQEIYLASEWF